MFPGLTRNRPQSRFREHAQNAYFRLSANQHLAGVNQTLSTLDSKAEVLKGRGGVPLGSRLNEKHYIFAIFDKLRRLMTKA